MEVYNNRQITLPVWKINENQIWSFIEQSISYTNFDMSFLSSIAVPPRFGLSTNVFPLNTTKPGTDIGIFVIVSHRNTMSCSINHIFTSLDSNLLQLPWIFEEPITSCLGPLTLKTMGPNCQSRLGHGSPRGVYNPAVSYILGLQVWLSSGLYVT